MRAAVKYALALVALAVAVAPVYWLVTISIKHDIDQFAVPPLWFRFQPTARHYVEIFGDGNLARSLWNSTFVASVSTMLAMLLGVPAAYGLERLRWPQDWSRKIGFWILSTRMLPPIVTIVPLFLMLRGIGLLNSRLGLILIYTTFNLPFVVWMMQGFFHEVPRELEEAAMMDGDSRMGALVRVVLPVTKPGLAATAVFCLIVAWNEFLFALILTQTSASTTLPVAIASRVTQYEIKWGAMSAAGVVAMVPVLVFAGMAQRYLVRGLSLGGVKG
jgi:multiple sugar transport system permease protein